MSVRALPAEGSLSLRPCAVCSHDPQVVAHSIQSCNQVYFRLSHKRHQEYVESMAILDNLWLEFEGLRDLTGSGIRAGWAAPSGK